MTKQNLKFLIDELGKNGWEIKVDASKSSPLCRCAECEYKKAKNMLALLKPKK